MDLNLAINLGKILKYSHSRYSLNLDGTNYMELSEPKTFAGDFEWTINTKNVVVLNKFLAAGDSNNTWLTVSALGEIKAKIDGYSTNTSTGLVADDGFNHAFKVIRTGQIVEVYYDDNLEATSDSVLNLGDAIIEILATHTLIGQNFQGIIHSVNLTDLDTPSNSISWNIDSGQPVYEAGGELVANGTFDTDTSGWTEYNLASISAVDGNLEVVNTDNQYGFTSHGVAVEVGKAYLVSIDVLPIDACRVRIGTTYSGSEYHEKQNISSNTTIREIVVATTTTLYVRVGPQTNILGHTGNFDNISVKPYISTISDGTIYQLPVGDSLGDEQAYGYEYWTKPNGAYIDTISDTVTFDGTQSDYAAVIIRHESGVSWIPQIGAYVVGFTVDATAGNVQIKLGGSGSGYKPTGRHSVVLIADGINSTLVQSSGAMNLFAGGISNISIKPVPQGLIMQNVSTDDWAKQ